MRDDDIDRDTPPMVVGAVAAGSIPLPFLAVYSVLFIVHGGFHPVIPPDITSTAHGELAVGIVALVLFVVSFIAVLWMLGGTRRWPFILVQLADLAAAIDLVVDSTRGGGVTAYILGAAAVVALVLALTPQASQYVGGPRWRPRRRPPVSEPAAPAASSEFAAN